MKILIFLLLSTLFLVSCNNNNVIPDTLEELKCETDSDCVPTSCCHPDSCTNKANTPECFEVMCTLSCNPGTLDCGQGSCVCENKKCTAKIK